MAPSFSLPHFSSLFNVWSHYARAVVQLLQRRRESFGLFGADRVELAPLKGFRTFSVFSRIFKCDRAFKKGEATFGCILPPRPCPLSLSHIRWLASSLGSGASVLLSRARRRQMHGRRGGWGGTPQAGALANYATLLGEASRAQSYKKFANGKKLAIFYKDLGHFFFKKKPLFQLISLPYRISCENWLFPNSPSRP